MAPEPRHICLMAGEASGDLLGSRLMRALKAQGPVRFSGIGGPLMETEGMASLFPIETLSIMGIAEILPRLPDLIARINQASAHVQATAPDVLVTIDSPDFCFRVARKIRAGGGKMPVMIHYVAPTVWAWRPERAAKVAKIYDGMMCLLPFEPPYFEREGLRAAFVGHSVLESGLGQGSGTAFRAAHDISTEAKVLGLFFGSRGGELKRMGPVLRDAAGILAQKYPHLVIVSPTLPHLQEKVRGLLQDLPCRCVVTADAAQKTDAFAALDLALATSGTVGLELAVADVPHAIGYKTSAPTAWVVRRKVTVRYAHLVNLLLDRAAVPEFLQENCTAATLAVAAETLLTGDNADQRAAFVQARDRLGGHKQNGPPSGQAASFVMSLIRA